MMKVRGVTQEEARVRLEQWRQAFFEPSYAKTAELIDINHSYLVQWKNGRDVGELVFRKILEFLEEQGY